VTSEFDVDERLAAENRRRIFDYVAKERLLVTGGHLIAAQKVRRGVCGEMKLLS
jgi:hypothetical protein